MAWVAMLACLLQTGTQEQYEGKLDKILLTAANEHYKIGNYLSISQMHEWARKQFYKAIELDPDHEKARRKLGYSMGPDGWVSDPKIKQKFSNQKKSERSLQRTRDALKSREERTGKNLARQWMGLGDWCRKKKSPPPPPPSIGYGQNSRTALTISLTVNSSPQYT